MIQRAAKNLFGSPLQFREQGHAFLFVRVGAGDDGGRGPRTGVEGQVGGDVEDVAGGDSHCASDGNVGWIG